VRAWSGPGSQLAFTYFTRDAIKRPSPTARVLRAVVARIGEPFRFGWDPAEMPEWIGARGFELVFDRSADESADLLLPATWARAAHYGGRQFALARVK
jgi:O-methyltransferase involved in polyketide biosynthesis